MDQALPSRTHETIDINNYGQTWYFLKENGGTAPLDFWKKVVRRYPSLIIYHPDPPEKLREIAKKAMERQNGSEC